MSNLILPDFDGSDVSEEMRKIGEQDYRIMEALALVMRSLDFAEKMTLALYAHAGILPESDSLCELEPTSEYCDDLTGAIALLQHLSPQGKCELAIDILSDDWDLGAVNPPIDAPSTLIK